MLRVNCLCVIGTDYKRYLQSAGGGTLVVMKQAYRVSISVSMLILASCAYCPWAMTINQYAPNN